MDMGSPAAPTRRTVGSEVCWCTYACVWERPATPYPRRWRVARRHPKRWLRHAVRAPTVGAAATRCARSSPRRDNSTPAPHA